MGDGSIPRESIDTMSAVGRWMDANAESIRGTSASPLATTPFDGRITTKGKTRYLHVFKRPESGTISVPFAAKKATLLAGGAALTIRSGDQETTIELPAELPDPIASVIRLE